MPWRRVPGRSPIARAAARRLCLPRRITRRRNQNVGGRRKRAVGQSHRRATRVG
jgi:hypothetical protein